MISGEEVTDVGNDEVTDMGNVKGPKKEETKGR